MTSRAGIRRALRRLVYILIPGTTRTTAFMVVNRNCKQPAEAALRVTLPGKALQELDRKTGTWTAGSALGADRLVKVRLSPGDGRRFRVAE
ncbi:MAG: hypothetical protein LLG01_13870 [Planctomycetaceae bacterium]|nr:hypothetical protein [Planctomycetaceae bacterium]